MLWDVVPELAPARPTVDLRPPSGAGPGGAGGTATLVLAGVSTDCCVLSTPDPVAGARLRGRRRGKPRKTLDVLALYAPLIEIVTSADLLPTAPTPKARRAAGCCGAAGSAAA